MRFLRRRGGWSGIDRGPSRIGFRSRVALLAALAVAAAVLISSAVIFVVVRQDMVGRADSALEHHAALLAKRHAKRGSLDVVRAPRRAPVGLSGAPILAQVAAANGSVPAREQAGLTLPVTADVRSVAAGRTAPYFADVTVNGVPARMFVTTFGRGLALQVLRPISELDAELGRLAAVLIVTSVAGVLLALLLGALVAGVALRPVRRLTKTAERVASTRAFGQVLAVGGNDELARLATSINTMLDALNTSQNAQRQLVADASHELRTPLTSLRTNVEVLAETPALDPLVRQQLVADLATQFDTLSTLLSDLVELARQDDPGAVALPTETLSVDEIVDEALGRARRNYPEVRFESAVTPARIRGVPADIERLMGNLLDNAAKWSLDGGVVEVHAGVGPDGAEGNGTVVFSVRDHGPGIDPEDLPHVFDRFYRGSGSGQVPGSGLGLAIVRRVVESLGGSVTAEPAPGGGSTFTVHLPSLAPSPDADPPYDDLDTEG